MPVLKGRLNKVDETKITKNRTCLLNELDAEDIVDCLIQEEVFSYDDREEICSQSTRKRRAEKLLDKLLHSGPGPAYKVFLEAIKEHYPHVAAKLESTPKGSKAGQTIELRRVQQKTATCSVLYIVSHLVSVYSQFLKMKGGSRCRTFDLHNSVIPALSFAFEHLPQGFRFKEVLDYIHSMAEQTVMIVGLRVSNDRPAGYPLHGKKGKKKYWCGNGRLWRVQRKFSTVDNNTCPCKDCEGSATPSKQWGEYIILTTRKMIYDSNECCKSVALFGYDSLTNLSDVSVLNGGSVICSDEPQNFSEVLYITHDADNSKRIEDICHRNSIRRMKLLDKCHVIEPGKTLAVLVSHPHKGPKQISVGEWRKDEACSTPGPSGHVYTAAACHDRSGASVLLMERGMVYFTLHSGRGPVEGTSRSNGKVWSL